MKPVKDKAVLKTISNLRKLGFTVSEQDYYHFFYIKKDSWKKRVSFRALREMSENPIVANFWSE